MIRDVTGIFLFPGNNGEDCRGNGKHYDKKGLLIECCCDGCAYLMCCTDDDWQKECISCKEIGCPRRHREKRQKT